MHNILWDTTARAGVLRRGADREGAGGAESQPRRIRAARRRLVDGAVLARPAAVARRLAVSASTLREWSTLYAEWLSPVAARGRDRPGAHRRYTPEDIGVLAQVAQVLQAGFGREAVPRMLRQRQQRTNDSLSPPSARDDEIARLKRELEAEHDLVKHVYGRLAPLEQRLEQTGRRLEQARADVEKVRLALAQNELANSVLRRENGALRLQLDEIARERARPLWKRVLS